MKKLLLLISSVFAFCFTGIISSNASMPIGGELGYVHLKDSTYQVAFKLYQDCAAASAPDSFNLCIRNTCNNVVLSGKMTLFNHPANGVVTNPFCANATTSCTDPGSKNIAYKVYFYTDTVTLPSRCNKWIFSVNAGKRDTLNNINYFQKDMVIEASLNNTVAHRNNSAYYSVWPSYVAEAGTPFYQKVEAWDADSDSLYTYLINPLTGITNCGDTAKPVLFNATMPPYNLVNNPIQTNNTFSQHKGKADFGFNTSVLQGHSTLAFRTDEYRNGVFIGSTMREMLIQVTPPTPAKPINVKLTCDTPKNSGSINDTIYACVNQQIEMCYAITTTSGSRVFISDDAWINMPGLTVTYTNQGTDSVHAKLSWTPGTADAGKNFTLNYLIADSTCNPGVIVKLTNKSFKFHVWGATTAGNDTTICPGTSTTLHVSGGGNFRWTILPGGTPNSLNDTTIANPVASPAANTTYIVRSTKNEYCQYRTKDTVRVNVQTVVPQPAISITVSPGVNVWQWLKVTFTANGTGCTNASYQWILNGSNIPGATSTTWSSTTLADNDVVSCRLTCADACSDPNDTVSNKITMNVATSVEHVGKQAVSLFPNPNNGTFTLQLGNNTVYHIEIVNTFGQVMHTTQVEKTSVFELPGLAQGIYTIKVRNDKETFSIKFTKL